MNAKTAGKQASVRVCLNRCVNMPLSNKRSILQLNERFTNGYRQTVVQIDLRVAQNLITPDVCALLEPNAQETSQ